MIVRKHAKRMLVACLLAIAFAPWESVLARTCSELFQTTKQTKKLPGITELRAKLPAVHLTDFFPRGGKLLARVEGRARFMPTVHLTLGEPVIDHDHGRWSGRKYAVVFPVGDIASQLVNVFPQDAIVLGHITLTKDARVLVPRGESPGDVGLAQVIYYDPQIPIKKAVADFIQREGMLQLRATGIDPKDSVSFNGEDVTGFEHWKELADHPSTYDLHVNTIWGRLDDHTHTAFEGVFRETMATERTIVELEYYLEEYRSLLPLAEAEFKKLRGLPASAHEAYNQAISRLKNFYIPILELELNLQKQQGKTLLGWDEGRKAGILPALESRSEFASFVARHLSKLPTLKQSQDVKRLYRLLERISIDFWQRDFFETGVMPDFLSSTDSMLRESSKFQRNLAEFESVLADLSGAHLSRNTLERIKRVDQARLYFKFIELELELRSIHGRTMLGKPGGQEKLIKALTSVSALENFVRKNLEAR